jgi:conjugative transfer signal peptidase TraF
MIARVFKLVFPLWFGLAVRPAVYLLAVVWGGWAACWYGDFRIAYSPSIPLGLYHLEHRPVARGDYVMFCPPPGPLFTEALRNFWVAPGSCPAGTRHLMKLVVAVEGDHVIFRDDGVFVDGGRVPNSNCRTTDFRGLTLPRPAVHEIVLGPDERVLMSLKGSASFDARYFGPIKGQIDGRLEPIFVWDQ